MRQGKTVSRFIVALFCGVISVAVTGCTHQGHLKAESQYKEVYDPLEPFNRAVFQFNDVFDRALVEPIADVYNSAVPPFLRAGLRNFLRNLRAPYTLANNILQGELGEAGATTRRFFLNSTAGVFGLVDVAEMQGWHHKPEDFGQTLGVWGFDSGFYFMVPILGPTTFRDGMGSAIENWGDPLRFWAFNTGRDRVYFIRNGLEGFTTTADFVDGLKDIRRNSLDYYAAVRSAYAQRRAALVRNESTRRDLDLDIPDYGY